MLPFPARTFWRVEGSLIELSALRPVAFFTSNAQGFSERWYRGVEMGLQRVVRPLLYAWLPMRLRIWLRSRI